MVFHAISSNVRIYLHQSLNIPPTKHSEVEESDLRVPQSLLGSLSSQVLLTPFAFVLQLLSVAHSTLSKSRPCPCLPLFAAI
jgi:hypothetical protein